MENRPAANATNNGRAGIPPMRTRLRRDRSAGVVDAPEAPLAADRSKRVLEMKWEQMFEKLLEYEKQFGNTLVPNRYRADPSLGAWVSTQRRQYKAIQTGKCESSTMSQERIRRLEAIGFVWKTADPRHVPWEDRFNELLAFKEKYGHVQVPIGFEDNVKLANWVSTQRQEAKLRRQGRPSRLTQERIDMLDDIGFVWEAQRGGRRKRDEQGKVLREPKPARKRPPPATKDEGVGGNPKMKAQLVGRDPKCEKPQKISREQMPLFTSRGETMTPWVEATSAREQSRSSLMIQQPQPQPTSPLRSVGSGFPVLPVQDGSFLSGAAVSRAHLPLGVSNGLFGAHDHAVTSLLLQGHQRRSNNNPVAEQRRLQILLDLEHERSQGERIRRQLQLVSAGVGVGQLASLLSPTSSSLGSNPLLTGGSLTSARMRNFAPAFNNHLVSPGHTLLGSMRSSFLPTNATRSDYLLAQNLVLRQQQLMRGAHDGLTTITSHSDSSSIASVVAGGSLAATMQRDSMSSEQTSERDDGDHEPRDHMEEV